MQRKKIILDLDMGIDDAMALAYVLGSPEVELIGIMASFGNVKVGTSARNILAVLDMLGVPQIPVYIGAPHALAATGSFVPSVSTTLIHGRNGIGEANIPDSPYGAVGTPEGDGSGAVDFLIESARAWGSDLIYVPTGPLTNLARALERDPAAVRSIGNITIMGGALTCAGNVSAGAEANMAADPEAADAVFRSGVQVTVVGLDVTRQVVLTDKDTARWRGDGTMAGCAFASMVDYYIAAYANSEPYLGGCSLHDPLAAAVAIDPTLIGAFPANLRVDLIGEYRGRTIGDPERMLDPHKSALVALTVDAPRFMAEFRQRMARAMA